MLHTRIDNGDQLYSLLLESFSQGRWIRKAFWVKGKHAVALHVIDIEMNHIQGQVALAILALLATLAANARLPAVYGMREFAMVGGLMSYGASLPDIYRRLAGFADKILKGTGPADLPIQRPTKFELVINLKAVKALGLTIPESLLLRADEVIEQ